MDNRNKILWGSEKNAVIFLVGINLVFFLFFKLMFMLFKNDPQTFLADYTDLMNQFLLQGKGFWQKPWTLLTYFFSHAGFFNLISNMLWLFSFAYLLQTVAGNRYIVPSYIYGGLVGGIVYLISTAILPANGSVLLGATTAILSVSATTVAFAPNYKIFPFINGGIPLWILFVLFLLVDFLTVFEHNVIILPAHLAAVTIGYLYGKGIQRGTDIGNWMHWIYNEFSGNKTEEKPLSKNKQFYKSTGSAFTKEKKVNQYNIDDLLDKINQKGINSLTKEEKNFLNKAKDHL